MRKLPEELKAILAEVDQKIVPRLREIDDQVVYNQGKVLKAFVDHQVAEADLKGTNGYGDDDIGREKLEAIYAQVFLTEDALVRPQFVSGTHTLAVALDGNLLPGETLTYLTGMPYDTMQQVIGLAPKKRKRSSSATSPISWSSSGLGAMTPGRATRLTRSRK